MRPKVLYFGRLFAWTKIAGGAVLGVLLFFNSPTLSGLSRPSLQISAAISLAAGYGLLRLQMWGLYLLTTGFVVTIVNLVMAGEQHRQVGSLPFGILWTLIGLWYFWEHRRDLEG